MLKIEMKLQELKERVLKKAIEKNGSLTIEMAILIVACVVIGGIWISSSTEFFKDTFLPQLFDKITGFFNYGS